eukprot:scaffold71043_cov63-Phaeocystis_antarctica.AAC.1
MTYVRLGGLLPSICSLPAHLPARLPAWSTPGASAACLARAGARGRARPRTARAGGTGPRIAFQQGQSVPACSSPRGR